MKKNLLTENTLRTRRLVCSAVLSALSFVFMWIGAVTDVLDLSMMMLASLCIAFAVIELGFKWAYLIWAVTSATTLLLLPSKAAAILYLMGGVYPVVKAYMERLPRILTWISKIAVFNVFQLVYILIAQKLLGLSGDMYSFLLPSLLFNNLLFVLYDIALSTFITFYMIRLRRRLRLPKFR